MQREIAGFHLDDEGSWVAELDCAHRVHVRHDPPWQIRPWVLSQAERAGRIGTALDCVRCDRYEMPESVRPYKRTKTFDQTTLPAGLRARHTTKKGVWAVIHVVAGELRYRVHEPLGSEQVIRAGDVGIVAPCVPHEVEPVGEVQLFVEFHRRDKP